MLGETEDLDGAYNHEYTEMYEQFDLNRDLGPAEYDEVAREKYKLKDPSAKEEVEDNNVEKEEVKKVEPYFTKADPNRKTIIEPMREL